MHTCAVHLLTALFLLLAPVAVTGAAAQAKPPAAQPDAGEIVVAIRYLLPQGVSHAHLFLFRAGDGKLLRQLTRDNEGQDRRPVFAPNGETVVFTREKPGNVREFWQVRPRGDGLMRLQAAPAWYKPAQEPPPYFANGETEPVPRVAPPPTEAFPRFRAPDNSVELILRENKDAPDYEVEGPGKGKHYVLHNLQTGKETEFGKLPGFYGAADVLHKKGTGERFLLDGSLHVAFFDLHLNSTDGTTVFALDLNRPRLVRLSPNWAAPFPLSGEAAFLTQTEVRYVPIAGSQKTANSSYIERWDSRLHKIRYARPNAAAVCYGASLYRPGRVPAVVTVPDSDP